MLNSRYCCKGRKGHIIFDFGNLLLYSQQVGWDESTAGERPSRVSIWEIEPVVTPFYICPPPFFRPRFPKQPGMPGKSYLLDISCFKHGQRIGKIQELSCNL